MVQWLTLMVHLCNSAGMWLVDERRLLKDLSWKEGIDGLAHHGLDRYVVIRFARVLCARLFALGSYE